MRRTLQVLNGLGVQESVAVYDYPYDHPYFGQLFLAGLLWITGYPSSLQVSDGPDLKNSIEMLHSMPRIIMGILAVLDTLLIFKITELYYNRNVAFIASILFVRDAYYLDVQNDLTGYSAYAVSTPIYSFLIVLSE